MLQASYQKILKNEFKTADFVFLKLVVAILQSIKQVNLEKLANALPIGIKFESRRRRLQRFLVLPNLTIEQVWYPILSMLISTYFQNNKIIYLAIDRTNWGLVNILMISIIWDKRAIPVYFELLPKLGSSNIEEQKGIISKIIPLFETYKLCILGDREFCSISLAKWLWERDLLFCLRVKKSCFVEVSNEIWVELNQIGLKPGTSIFYQGVRITKSKGFQPMNLVCQWKRKIKGVAPDEGWFLVTNFDNLESAVLAYKQRFDIEEMFRSQRRAGVPPVEATGVDFKSGGYNLEDTNASQKRLVSLIILISIAYTSATLQGKTIKQKGIQEYVCRPKEPGRQIRRHSSFYVGIYAQTWVDFKYKCADLVVELMKFNRNKWKFYRKGERAMKLIESTL
ncbi:MAG: IS4 family transposase [Heteroscytonema crispum UTEX LB 1556]